MNRRIPNGTYGGVRGMNNLYSIGERSEPVSRMVILPYDTESKSRNVLASPLGEEGHEVAKGCTRVRMIMILDVDVTTERRHYNTHCPKGNPQPSGPKAPSNLRTLGTKAHPS